MMKNKTKLIRTNKYLLLVDVNTRIIENWKGYIYKKDATEEVFHHSYIINRWYDDAKIVIGYYPLSPEAKELDLPLLPTFEEVGIEKLAETHAFNWYEKEDRSIGKNSFIEGYKAAQAKQLELLKRAIQLASDAENIEEVTEEIIQSLFTQQLPKNFESEYEINKYSACGHDTHILKTTTNSQGKKVLCGEYKY